MKWEGKRGSHFQRKQEEMSILLNYLIYITENA